MSSEWRGVHNQDSHIATGSRATCGICGQHCYAASPCWCCEEETLGDYTAADLLARVDAARYGEWRWLRALATAQLQLALLTTALGVFFFSMVFAADGPVAAGFFAVSAAVLAYASAGHWKAVRRTRGWVATMARRYQFGDES